MNEKAFGAAERCIHRLEELLREGASTESIALMRRAYAEVDNARKLLEAAEPCVIGHMLPAERERLDKAITACRASAGKIQTEAD